uniref:USP domain-containing protein n=1 Tax=Caenorhabditis japonica TaxID=281687 RepID=A0A8R1DEN8_CAEJA
MVGEREGEVSTRKSKRHKSTKNGYRREVFDVGKAVRKIDKACKKAENKRRSVDSDESISADTSSETSESSLGAPIFSTPVETSSDAPSDVVMQLKRTRRRKVSESVTSPIEPKRRSARIKDDEGAILKKGDGIPISDIIKRRKFYSRVDYNRHYFDNLSEKILNKVLTPADQGDCQILTHFTYPVIRRAIVNKSTLCYAISMLQVMTRVPQIYSIIRSHNHKGTQKAKCFLCLLADTFAAKPSLDDFSTFINIIKEIWPTVDVDMMHCVMEAMQHFFDKFDMEFSRQHSKYVYDHNEDFSLTRSFFEIEMVNEFKCTVCDHVFGVKDKAVYLSIDLSRKSNGTMQGYLDNFSLPTAACGIECTYCKADKFTCTTHFSKLPEVLLYFIPRVRTRRNDKDMTVVEVQKEIVVRTKTEEQQYALCAFVTHHGDNGRKGHYKMFEVDNQHPDKPYNEFDDAKVIHDALLTWDMTVVLAMFRKIDAVAKDAPTDIIFDGRGNVVYANEKYVAEANADYRRYQ